jgi:hypothetical protein
MASYVVKWGGPAAIIGGILWVVAAIATASKPRGCIADECAYRTMRETGVLVPILTLAAVALIAVGLAGLVVRAVRSGSFGRLGRSGLVTILAGAALAAAGTVMNAWNPSLVPAFIIPGVLAIIVGFVLLGIAVLTARVLPRWAAAALILGSLCMLAFNDQNAQVLFGIPFGIAWIVTGYALGLATGDAAPRSGRVR